jgi:uncharacterized oligopeptide transporter (OPT) family protein
MPMAVGMYLPFGLGTPILIGGLMAHFVTRRARGAAQKDRLLHPGVLFASGIIAGEALMGVGRAGLVALKVPDVSLPLPGGAISLFTVLLAAAVLGAFWIFSRPRSD